MVDVLADVALPVAIPIGVVLFALYYTKWRKKPRITATCYNKGWESRGQNTSVAIFLAFENSAQAAETTIKECSLEIEYDGSNYGPFKSEMLNERMTAGRAWNKRVAFLIPVDVVSIQKPIQKATLQPHTRVVSPLRLSSWTSQRITFSRALLVLTT